MSEEVVGEESIVVRRRKYWLVQYLRISVLMQSMTAIIKSRDGVNTPDANNSNSQCCPVKPRRQ